MTIRHSVVSFICLSIVNFVPLLYMKSVSDHITIDQEILGGTPVFKGTRVPVESLFWHLEDGVSLEAFLDDFPSVDKDQALAVLEIAGKLVSSQNIQTLYETAA